ncbi:hypothetical protein MalM25_31720 [Planctomycetes bacterium MalM25]|nr:hypothetical protein MalM25_31720 [Planctomycetes bacterium MalM25]
MLLEKTQRRLCRLLFVLGCVLPTLAVAGMTVGRVRPGFAADLLAAAGERLGVEVACDRLTTPRPGVYALEGVRLLTPSTGDELAHGDRLRLERRDGVWRFSGGTVRLSPRLAEARWLRRLLASDTLAHGELSQLRLSEGDPLQGVVLRLSHTEANGRRLQINSEDGWKFDATDDAGVTRVAVETSAAGLASEWLAATPLRWAAGEGARFAGRVTVESRESNSPSLGTAEGRLVMGSLASPQLNAASGEVRLDSLRWTGERIDHLAGRLDLRNGSVNGRVVWGACQWLATPPRDRLQKLWADPAARNGIPFSQLACEIELGPAGVALAAGCGEIDGRLRPGAVAHAVLEHEGEALLLEPVQRPLPPQRLVQAWFPDHRAELPAEHAAIELMRALPAPSERQEAGR